MLVDWAACPGHDYWVTESVLGRPPMGQERNARGTTLTERGTLDGLGGIEAQGTAESVGEIVERRLD